MENKLKMQFRTKLSCLDAVKRKHEDSDQSSTSAVPKSKKRNRPIPSLVQLGTVVGLVTDRSGSMLSLMGTQITGSMNIISDWQKPGKNINPAKTHCLVYTFDDRIKCSFHGTANILTESCLAEISEDMLPRGSTALYDAVIQFIKHQQKMVDDIWAGLSKTLQTSLRKLDFKIPVVLIVFTDGQDNCSIHSIQDMKRVVEEHRKKYGAKCIFAGANFNVQEQGQLMGFAPQLSLQVSATLEHSANAYQSIRQCSNEASMTSGGIDPGFTQLQRQMSVDVCDQSLYGINNGPYSVPSPVPLDPILIPPNIPNVTFFGSSESDDDGPW